MKAYTECAITKGNVKVSEVLTLTEQIKEMLFDKIPSDIANLTKPER